MSAVDKIPVVLITGFLGSGKTVLLNALLQRPELADSAVIVNEFGTIGLDHLLVASAKDNIVLLDAGCLCCAVLGSLKETLLDLHQRRASGELPAFRRVLVETSGLANPGPILQSIMRDPVVSHFFRPGGLICVVDALHGEAQLNEHIEAQAQIALADRIVVTKTDVLDGVCPAPLQTRMRMLNSDADVFVASFGQVDADRLLRPEPGKEELPWLGGAHAAAAHTHSGEAHMSDVSHDVQIGSESFVFASPVSWPGLAAWIDVLRRRYGRDLLRCKGIVNIANTAVVVHGVETLFDTRRLAQWPDAERRSRIVLIGKGLNRADLEHSLSWLTQTDGNGA
jgi:G3E family GTPase